MGKTRIIALEGIDGSGKTMQMSLLRAALEAQGHSCAVRSFPVYESFFGYYCGEYLSGQGGIAAHDVDAKSMSLWYALDRWESFKDYQDGESEYLLINRYVLSNAVYQSVRDIDLGKQLPMDWALALEHDHFGLPKPDAYIFLDVPAHISGGNVDKKGFRDYVGEARDVYEASHALQQRARERYLQYADVLDNVLVVECTDDAEMLLPEEIASRVWKALQLRGLV